MLKYIIRYKFSILLAILIALLSLLPSSSLPDSNLFSVRFLDKIIHLSMYLGFVFVFLAESRCYSSCLRFHLKLILTVFAMSAMIELLQETVIRTRSAEWLDLLANLMGLIAGYVIFRIALKLNIIRQVKS